jgi:hypothetical protein
MPLVFQFAAQVDNAASILGLYADENQAAIGEPNIGEPQAPFLPSAFLRPQDMPGSCRH